MPEEDVICHLTHADAITKTDFCLSSAALLCIKLTNNHYFRFEKFFSENVHTL